MIPFLITKQKITNNILLTIIEIEELNSQFAAILDENFISICEGSSGSDLITVKQRVLNLYQHKESRWIMGATAEFFIHLYVTLSGYKQECMFLNLEEGSIKKGFDGLYSSNSLEWLMESKSGSINTNNICHSSKIKSAMNDLEKKVSGKSTNGKSINNPWQNAYSHANNYDVGSSEEIRKNLKKLSDDFTNGHFYDIEDFNVMPCSTIFLEDIWNPQSISDTICEIQNIICFLKGKQVQVICSTQKSVNLFLKYLATEG